MKRAARWEWALLIALLVSFAWGTWADRTQQQLSDKVLRLHVLANSDSEADQALKLKVRDSVLETASAILADCPDRETAEQRLSAALLEIEDAANSRLEQMMPDMAKAAGVTEALKAADPMKWVGLMNNLKAQAEEIILTELIHA